MDELKALLEIISLLITILGVPIAIYIFYKEKRKERLDREYGTYNALDDKYLYFLNLCLSNADLGIHEMTDKKLTHEQQIRANIIFEILICLFERSFLMYQGHNDKIRKSQWNGWNAYIEDWMENKNFNVAWETFLNSQYDTNFLKYMNEIYQKKVIANRVKNGK